MSKRVARKGKKRANKLRQKNNRKHLAIVCSLLILTFGIAVMAQWKILPSLSKPLASPSAQQGNFNANSPSKEYIYAGGRLIATEEPTGGNSTLLAPAAFSATTASNTQINLTWTAPAGAVNHYIVERSEGINGQFAQLSPNPTTTSFTDTTVTSGVAYLYRVKAVDSNGQATAASNPDVATAVSFTDDPLIANSTFIKGQHLVELRQAINAVRLLAGLTAASWTDPAPQGAFIRKLHIEELRASLDQALTTLGLATQTYTDPTLTTATTIKKTHFDELRQRVK